ncbi:MAG: DNA helicase UvrD [Candidatus Rokubacteria bacterium]|nr:DNA helicase UvrD [Candidatus Rokubacteria bacterium]
MRVVADFHVHSRYSRATSRDMEVETLARWARWKGVTLLGTGDFTHPTYFAELKAKLAPTGNGLFVLKRGPRDVSFMLTVEVSNVYVQGGRQRRIHTLIFAPSLEIAARINRVLAGYGKLASDGRPMLGCAARDLAQMVLDVSAECALVPAHAWTPWSSVFGANSGFDSLEECYGAAAARIFAIETGLSSDPPMNWRWSALDRIALISNSDAHSPSRIAREANVLDAELTYRGILDAIRCRDPARFLFTIEFFPHEGKYHWDGHRACGVSWPPEETRRHGGRCTGCGRPVTVGVMHRVEALADRPEGFVPARAVPGRNLVPLAEIVAEALGVGAETGAVESEWMRLIAAGGSELAILIDLPEAELARFTPPRILDGIRRVRAGELSITPGYDGVYGKVSIFGAGPAAPTEAAQAQLALF